MALIFLEVLTVFTI